ncbi:Glycosyl transferase family 2 [Mariprofundus aestuarium]|uniref:Glycosyl transferase family 2 n=1 Tax=Mariprofundus aestuarium TaxID=1921086 RepID=A0A2K8L0D5_MARES|nr:glycosyltransferase [Mariprofundus aestuarium]ATX79659.1 Glycosyl transferase family 2 [Mariprofundus aestuarium]
MKISIVTASYNAEAHVEAALDSVLSQHYSDLEYIVIDGASKDATFQVVEKCSDGIAYCVSEPDEGQYHAIQKGLDRASGEIMAWLNADDIYMPWTFSVVAEIFEKYPEVQWITGLPGFMNEQGQYTGVHASAAAYPQHYICNGWYQEHLAGYLQQESMFWRRSLWEKTSGLDLSLDLAADFKLWTEFAKHAELVQITTPLAAFRKRPGVQKSSLDSDGYRNEVATVCETLPRPPTLWSKIASIGVAARSLCRLVQVRQAKVIAYVDSTQSWEMVSLLRPISRVGLGQMFLEYRVRNKNSRILNK